MISRGRALPWRGLGRGVWVVVCLAAVAGSALAAPADAGDAEARAVTVTILGEPGESSRVDESVREVTRRMGLSGDVGAARALARVTVDLRGADVVVLVTDGDGQPLVRRSIPRPASQEVLREEIALIVADALDAARALETERAARRSPPATSSAPPAVVPDIPPERGTSGARTEVGGLVVMRDRDANAHVSPGLGLAARVASNGAGLRPMGGVSADLSLPYDVDARGVALHVSPYALRVSPGVTGRVSGAVELDATAGLGLDALHVLARSPAPTFAAGDPTTKVSPLLAPAVAARFRLGAARLSFSAGVDVDLVRRRYVVASPGGNAEALEPRPVRPVLMLGLSLPLGGADDAE